MILVLTRLRLGHEHGGAGRLRLSRRLLDLHTWVGASALVVWLVFVVAPEGSVPGGAVVGIVGLGLWWVVAALGLLILVRWLPSRGRHSSPGTQDGWSQGPWLSVLAHLAMVAVVGVFTWSYLTSAV